MCVNDWVKTLNFYLNQETDPVQSWSFPSTRAAFSGCQSPAAGRESCCFLRWPRLRRRRWYYCCCCCYLRHEYPPIGDGEWRRLWLPVKEKFPKTNQISPFLNKHTTKFFKHLHISSARTRSSAGGGRSWSQKRRGQFHRAAAAASSP